MTHPHPPSGGVGSSVEDTDAEEDSPSISVAGERSFLSSGRFMLASSSPAAAFMKNAPSRWSSSSSSSNSTVVGKVFVYSELFLRMLLLPLLLPPPPPAPLPLLEAIPTPIADGRTHVVFGAVDRPSTSLF